jgi:hypothetical protein
VKNYGRHSYWISSVGTSNGLIVCLYSVSNRQVWQMIKHMKLHVVTCPGNGWDCVVGVYKTRKRAVKHLREDQDVEDKILTDDEWLEENGYIIHEKYLDDVYK